MPATTTSTPATTTSTPPRLSEGILDAIGLKLKIGTTSPNMSMASITVPVSYFGNRKFTLTKPRVSVTKVSITPSGSIKEIPPFWITVDRCVGLDSTGTRGYSDTFFLANGSLTFPNPITLAGLLKLTGVTLTVKDLTNHPVLLKEAKRNSGFLGTIALKASKVEFPAIPSLVIACKQPTQHTNKAWGATYDVANGTLAFELDHASYTTKQVDLDVDDSKMMISNNAKDISIKGSALLSLPALGLDKLSSTLELKMVDKKLSTFDATLATTKPLTPLGITGQLAFNHNFADNSGALTLSKGAIAGVGVKGKLSYSAAGASTDRIYGALTIDNLTGKGLNLGAFDLSLVPRSGTAAFSFAPKSTAASAGFVNFTNVEFDFVTGTSKASFVGNLKMDLSKTGVPSLKELDLTLKNPVSIDLAGLGSVSLQPVDANTPVKFSLKSMDATEGTTVLVPTMTGLFIYDSNGPDVPGGQVTAGGIAYQPDDWNEGAYAWNVLDITA